MHKKNKYRRNFSKFSDFYQEMFAVHVVDTSNYRDLLKSHTPFSQKALRITWL